MKTSTVRHFATITITAALALAAGCGQVDPTTLGFDMAGHAADCGTTNTPPPADMDRRVSFIETSSSFSQAQPPNTGWSVKFFYVLTGEGQVSLFIRYQPEGVWLLTTYQNLPNKAGMFNVGPFLTQKLVYYRMVVTDGGASAEGQVNLP